LTENLETSGVSPMNSQLASKDAIDVILPTGCEEKEIDQKETEIN